MNPPSFPDDPETRITALLLGELDPAEAAEVRAAMAADPELARLHDQLQATITAVRQTLAPEASGAPMPEGHPEVPRMAEERRRRLLREFQGAPLVSPGFRKPSHPSRAVPWQVSLARAAAWVALLSIPALLLPYWLRTEFKMSPPSAHDGLSEELARADRSGVGPGGSRPSIRSFGRTEESERYRRGEPASLAVAASDPGAPMGGGGFGGFGGGGFGASGVSITPPATGAAAPPSPEAGAFLYLPSIQESVATATPSPVPGQQTAGVPLLGDAPTIGLGLAPGSTRFGFVELEQLAGQPTHPTARAFGIRDRESALARDEAVVVDTATDGLVSLDVTLPIPAYYFSKRETDVAARSAPTSLDPQPEVVTASDPFSTFSLNVTDVSFKLAAASLERGHLPEPGTVRVEEFVNAFEYHDPEPAPGRRVGLTWERARYPFAHQRDLLRLSVKTAARGREPVRPLNLVLCLDSSGSMERADRVQIVREALTVLAGLLQPADRVSVVAFARTARLWVDALPGSQADALLQRVNELTPEGGTNLEEALRLAYATAARHHRPDGTSRVVLLTDGAANLGNVDPESLRQFVITHRQQGIALDCFGVGWEGYHDDLLETLSRNGDGRYGFLNTPEEAAAGFAAQLAGALQVAASDVKVQVEFNPDRVRHHRLIGYAKHRLTQEQFRDNTVDAAELGAAESGNALYVIETDAAGTGPVAVVRVRFKLPATERYDELEWALPYDGPAVALDRASPALRLAATAGAFAEWLGENPHAAEVNPETLLHLLRGVPDFYPLDPRPGQLEWMIRQAGSIRAR